MVKLLELFKGTGSFGKAAKKLKWDVISLDNEDKFKPDILTDILDFDYKNIGFTPDIITASPPCGTFSSGLALTKRTTYDPRKAPRVRNSDTMKPLHERAVIGDKILKQTIKIINYWRKRNPKLKFIMENPRGSMYRSPYMKALKPYFEATTYYCLYGDGRTKRTDFFNNFELKLKEGSCRGTELVTKLPLCEKYKIPQPLITSMFKQLKVSLGKTF